MAQALIVPAQCSMGRCGELIITSKRPIRLDAKGTLYEVKVGYREWPSESPKPNIAILPFKKPTIDYVFCSTSRPAYIFQHPDFYSTKGSASNYLAHLLNPDGQSFYGYNKHSYSIYWATCHSFVEPNFFSPDMVTKSIELGYPGNLHEEQIQLGHPLDIFR